MQIPIAIVLGHAGGDQALCYTNLGSGAVKTSWMIVDINLETLYLDECITCDLGWV